MLRIIAKSRLFKKAEITIELPNVVKLQDSYIKCACKNPILQKSFNTKDLQAIFCSCDNFILLYTYFPLIKLIFYTPLHSFFYK